MLNKQSSHALGACAISFNSKRIKLPDPEELPTEGTITAIRPSSKILGRVSIHVDHKSIGSVNDQRAAELGLILGATWTEDLAHSFCQAASEERARSYALNALTSRAMSKQGLIQRLRARGHDQSIAQSTASRCAQMGLIDDKAFAEAFARSELSRRPAGHRLIEYKLRSKGIEQSLAAEVASAATIDRDPIEDAVQLIIRRVPENLSPDDLQRTRRRLAGRLARRGFDAHTTYAALKRVLGS